MIEKEKSALEKLEDALKDFWRENGKPSIVAARHTEFVIEPKVFMGTKLNPEILKLLVVNYLAHCSKQDSGLGEQVEASPEKIIIKTKKGKPIIVIRDKQIIEQYLQQA